jgi:hypothetical protein
MATYSHTTNAIEDAAMAWLLRVENARRAALIPPLNPVTATQLVGVIMDNAFNDYVKQYRDRVNQQVKDNYDAATNATQASVRTTLGVDPATIV